MTDAVYAANNALSASMYRHLGVFATYHKWNYSKRLLRAESRLKQTAVKEGSYPIGHRGGLTAQAI